MRTVLFCILSASLGALVALQWHGAAEPLPNIVAQEPGVRPETPIGAPGSVYGTAPSNAAVAVSPPANGDEYTPEERVSIAIYENVNRAVVNITTETVRTDGIFFENLAKGEGSGSVITREGHVLTNFHVVEGARVIQVTLFDGKTYEAKLIGQDPTVDVAVLKIDAPQESLFPVTFGDSTHLRVGQRVYAIGNPFGLERTLSTGIISSLNRSIPSRRSQRTIKQIIQIDAAINPGNSGGPLLDTHCRMIGMNTAIASKTGDSAGVAFAIPVTTIARIVPTLIKDGHVVRADAGIARVYQTDKGLLIAAVSPGGPAEAAGLQGPKVVNQRRRQGPFVYDYQTVDRSAADLIVAVDDKPIRTADQFLNAIEAKQPGETAVLGVIRGGQRINVSLKLSAAEN